MTSALVLMVAALVGWVVRLDRDGYYPPGWDEHGRPKPTGCSWYPED